jgi:type IV pilus assembly protein PilB
MKKNLGLMLLEANLIDEVQMKIALEVQKKTGKRFGSTLVDLKFIDENVLAAFLSKQIDIPCISLLNIAIPQEVIEKVPYEIAKKTNSMPIKIESNFLFVAMVDPTDLNSINEIENVAKMPVVPLIAPQSSIEKVIKKYYEKENLEETKPSLKELRSILEEVEAGSPVSSLDEKIEKIEKKLDQAIEMLKECLSYLKK